MCGRQSPKRFIMCDSFPDNTRNNALQRIRLSTNSPTKFHQHTCSELIKHGVSNTNNNISTNFYGAGRRVCERQVMRPFARLCVSSWCFSFFYRNENIYILQHTQHLGGVYIWLAHISCVMCTARACAMYILNTWSENT